MALPPEPIEEVLPEAALVIEAEVAEVLATGAAPAPVQHGGGNRAPAQTVKLKVLRVLRGPAGLTEVVAEKPAAGYALRSGNQGPFLLDRSQPTPKILGRYGPDTWSMTKVLGALKK